MQITVMILAASISTGEMTPESTEARRPTIAQRVAKHSLIWTGAALLTAGAGVGAFRWFVDAVSEGCGLDYDGPQLQECEARERRDKRNWYLAAGAVATVGLGALLAGLIWQPDNEKAVAVLPAVGKDELGLKGIWRW